MIAKDEQHARRQEIVKQLKQVTHRDQSEPPPIPSSQFDSLTSNNMIDLVSEHESQGGDSKLNGQFQSLAYGSIDDT